jgi:hypothetical protein
MIETKFTTQLQAGTVEAVGLVEVDDMGNVVVVIKIKGKILSETQISKKEMEILASWILEGDKK